MRREYAIFLALMLLVYLAWSPLELLPHSVLAVYGSAYQGADALFWKLEDGTSTGLEHLHYEVNATVLVWDPDEDDKWMCDLVGEMTNVYIPHAGMPKVPEMDPAWVDDVLEWENPERVYKWYVGVNETHTEVYRMELWQLAWFVCVSSEYDSKGYYVHDDEVEDRRYYNLRLWFKLRINEIWYMEGVEATVFFAIAEISLFRDARRLVPEDGWRYEPVVAPSEEDSHLTIITPYEEYERKHAYEYEGKKLNPALFVREAYTYVVLKNFGTQDKGAWPWTYSYTNEVVVFPLRVRLFVMGQWVVKAPEEDVKKHLDEYARPLRTFLGWSAKFLNWLRSPWVKLALLGLIPIILLALLAYTGALPVLLAFISRVMKK